MKVQLDTNAMNALFPEGSEARVQLQNAVIANFAGKIKDKYLNDEVVKAVRETVDFVGTEQKIASLIRSKLECEFQHVNQGWYSTVYKLNDRQKISEAVNQYATGAAGVLRDEMVKQAKPKIDSMFEYTHKRVLDGVADAVTKAEADMLRRVEQRISAKMDEIIRMELAKLLSQGSFLSHGASVQPTAGLS